MSDVGSFLYDSDVKRKLGVPSYIDYIGHPSVYMSKADLDISDSEMSKVEYLLNDGIPLLALVGDTDFICAWQGNLEWMRNLRWEHSRRFKE